MKTDQPLFTGNYPVVILINKGRAQINLIDLAKSQILFPLSPNLLLVGTPNENRKIIIYKTKNADKNLVELANKEMFRHSNQIIAREKTEIEGFLHELS